MAAPPRSYLEHLSSRRTVPFWILQAGELLLALGFVDLSFHVARGALLVYGAGALAALAISAKGPFGVLRICSRRRHVRLAVVVGLLLALAPALPTLRPDAAGIIVVEFGAVGLVRLSALTRTEEGTRSPTRTLWRLARQGSRIDSGSTGFSEAIDTTAVEGGQPAGGRARSRARATMASEQVDHLARWAGLAAGAASALASDTVVAHGPALRRGARGVLRAAGRATGRVRRGR